jgi:hypothetical protein
MLIGGSFARQHRFLFIITDSLASLLPNRIEISADLTEYPRVSVSGPKPALAGMTKPGQSVEGCVAFAVNRNDSKPVMVFDPDTGGATGRGRTLFFKLY